MFQQIPLEVTVELPPLVIIPPEFAEVCVIELIDVVVRTGIVTVLVGKAS